MRHIAIGLALLAVVAGCGPKENPEAEKAAKDFETFVNTVEQKSEKTWEDIETEYKEQESKMEEYYDEMSEKTKAKVDELKTRYNEVKAKQMENAEAAQIKMQSALNDLEAFVQSTSQDVADGTVEAWEDIEAQYQEKKAKLDSSMQIMKADAQARFEEIKEDFDMLRKNVGSE